MCNTLIARKNFPLCLYVTDLSYPDSFYDKWYALLPAARSKRADGIRNDINRKRCIAAYALLVCGLRDLDLRVGLDGADIAEGRVNIEEDENGKPYLTDIPVYFNISHSGDRIAIALACEKVGCDVEHKCSNELSIVKRFFTREEYEAVSAITDDAQRKDLFVRMWTLKESVVKCTGEGIRRGFDDFSLIDDKRKIKACVRLKDVDEDYYIKEYPSENGYRYSVCCTSNDMEDSVRRVRLE